MKENENEEIKVEEKFNVDVSVEEEETIKNEKGFIQKIKTMSKKKKIIWGSVIAVIIAVVTLGIIFASTISMYTSTIFKRKITSQEFTNILNEYSEFETFSIMEYIDGTDMDDAVVSQKGYDISIEFYDFINNELAQQNYIELKELMEETVAETEDSTVECFELLDTGYMEIIIDEEYAVLSKVGDTFIFGVSYVDNKEELDEIIKACGY